MSESLDDICPVDEPTRKWIETAFSWMVKEFGIGVLEKKTLVPDDKDFPIRFTGKIQDAEKVLQILARQMDFDPSTIDLHIYREGIREVNIGGIQRIFMQTPEDARKTAGLYFGKGENGLYEIGLAEDTLKDPEGMIGTFAHELAHVKLLGEKRLQDNNEPLTDLLSVFFGVGIFNANKAFVFKNTFDSKLIGRSGYLTEMEWGYALAIYAYLKGNRSPGWLDFLIPNVKKDFIDSFVFIESAAPDIIGTSTGMVEVGILPRFKTKQETPDDELIRKRHSPSSDSPFYDDFCKANDFYKQRDYALAVELYSKILENGGTFWVAFYCGFYSLLTLKKYYQLAGLFDAYKDSFDIKIKLYINAGYAHDQIGNRQQAKLYYEKALEMDAYNIYALNNVGLVLNKMGDFQEAVEHFDLALEVDPSYAYAYNNRGYAKIKLGQVNEGYKDIMHALELKSDNAYAYFNLGVYHLVRKEHKLALLNFEKAKELDPGIENLEEQLAVAKS